MFFVEIIPSHFQRSFHPTKTFFLACWLVLLGSLHAWSIDRAYYSDGKNVTVPSGASRVDRPASPASQGVPTSLVATVEEPTLFNAPTATVRIPLNGVAPAGYRAGVLVSSVTGLLSVGGPEVVTLTTYLGTVSQESRVVDATLLNVSLLPLKGLPRQLEFSMATTKSFDKVEISFNPSFLTLTVFSVARTNILYAYGVTQGEPRALTGYLSQFVSPASSRYTLATGVSLPLALCVGNAVVDPLKAVDEDLTNYAYFNSTLSVGCTSFLKVDLNGTAPAVGYRAGFVIGTSGLVGTGVLTGIKLRTYLNGTLQETASALSLLDVTLLADGKSFVSFKATKAFNAVSIERASTVAVLDDLRLYFGFGLPEAVLTTGGFPIITSLPITLNNTPKTFEVFTTASLCFSCNAYVIVPTSVPEDAYVLLHNGAGVNIINKVIFTELTGPGLAGYRAGVVLGETTLVDVDLQRGLIIATFDENDNVLETATSEALLTVNLLPNRRRELSFRTTRNFARIGVYVNTAVAAISDLSVYSAFADEGGLIQVNPPTGPLPVVLTSFAVSRAADAAAHVAWATASERNSAYFVVERTTDPQAGFAAIGRVAAAGTSATGHAYSLRDATAPTRATSYYRLRQVDLDGTETLSPVVALAGSDDTATGFALYPNPAPAGTVGLRLRAPVAEGTTLVVYSTVGQVLRRQAVSSGPTPTLSTEGLPTGMYHVVLRDAGGQSLGTQRLLITND